MTELAIVVAILSCIALLAVPRVTHVRESACRVAAESDLRTLALAIGDNDSGYLRDFIGIPGFSPANIRLANLFMPTNLYGAVVSGALPIACRVDVESTLAGCATAETFTRWDAAAERGWHGPYVQNVSGVFPSADDVRFPDDSSFAARGFFPPLDGLRVPDDFRLRRGGCSIYGFPGEPTLIDPWGNPYVLQIPPPQAFRGANTNLPDAVRFRYARLVSAGQNGVLDSPCFAINMTNRWETTWTERVRRLARQAGRIGNDLSARGDDLVLFLNRTDCDEGNEE